MTRESGKLVRSFTVREARGADGKPCDRPAELRTHDGLGPVVWFDDGGTWQIFVAGIRAEGMGI